VKLHCFILLFLATACVPSTSVCADPPSQEKQTTAKNKAKISGGDWTNLNGKWEACEFGGDGEIEIKPNSIKMQYGDPITGVRWAGDVLRDNYELELEGRRVDGFDFFCAVTFPVGEKGQASLVLGGWGGGTMGISSIDDHDASDNETTQYRDFKNDQWYKARIRVEESRIAVWIDDVLEIQQPRKGHRFDIRGEMDPCLPLGLANFQCESEIKNLRFRPLAKNELGQKLKSKKVAEKAPAVDEETVKKEAVAK
jgi:hypothetical protein